MKEKIQRQKEKKYKVKLNLFYLDKECIQKYKMSFPRTITAAEVLDERAELENTSNFPHGTGRGWSSMYWVSCDCPPCRNCYDPTGTETAQYLNMEYPSFFHGQSEQPSFVYSKLFDISYLAHSKPGFYVDHDRNPLTLEEVITRLTPPLALYPFRILRIGKDHVWDEFLFVNKEGKEYAREEVKYHPHAGMVGEMRYVRRSYKNGRIVYYKEGEEHSIPFELNNNALMQRLKELFSE